MLRLPRIMNYFVLLTILRFNDCNDLTFTADAVTAIAERAVL